MVMLARVVRSLYRADSFDTFFSDWRDAGFWHGDVPRELRIHQFIDANRAEPVGS